MIQNRETIEVRGEFYSGETIKQSYIINQQFAIDQPSFLNNHLNQNVVEDQISFLWANIGIIEKTLFYILEKQTLMSSAFNDYENGRYKFIGY
jgi:hypothetical protein